MDTREFANLLIHAGEQGGIDIRPYPYSGRGMYGAHCVGITLDSLPAVIELGYNIGKYAVEDDNGRDELKSIFTNYSHDSMGLRVVVYWPQMKIDQPQIWRQEDE